MNLDLPVTEAVLITIISGPVATILGAIVWIGRTLIETKRTTVSVRNDTAATRYQVENHHTTNLREDNDVKHEEVKALFKSIDTRLTDEMASVHRRLDGHMDRFTQIDRRLNNREEKK